MILTHNQFVCDIVFTYGGTFYMTEYLVGETLSFENEEGKELELEIIDIFDYNGDIIFCLAFKENDDSLYIMKAVADCEDTFDPVTDEEYDLFYQIYVQRVEQFEEEAQKWS